MKAETSHGSAAFATAKEIDEAGLGKKVAQDKKSGVVVIRHFETIQRRH